MSSVWPSRPGTLGGSCRGLLGELRGTPAGCVPPPWLGSKESARSRRPRGFVSPPKTLLFGLRAKARRTLVLARSFSRNAPCLACLVWSPLFCFRKSYCPSLRLEVLLLLLICSPELLAAFKFGRNLDFWAMRSPCQNCSPHTIYFECTFWADAVSHALKSQQKFLSSAFVRFQFQPY
jgi:hypothetical protein